MPKFGPIPVKLRGRELIREPLLNKGSAFSAEERQIFGLEGLLPDNPVDIERQAEKIYRSICRFEDPLEKYVALAALQDRNEHLYFHVLTHHLREFMPIVYTPTVGLATQKFSHVFQRGRGIWINPGMKGRVAEVLRNGHRGQDIRLIVVTDNESILGIGDQGAGGMAISIGKLALYTAGAGIAPYSVLPVSIDVGTDNEELLGDDQYLGWRHKRLRGPDYDELIQEFVDAVQAEFPKALVQWEDFRKDNALAILDRYQQVLPSFNDDIQGTGSVALAGVLTSGRISGRALKDERIVILGAGAAGLGITRQIRRGLEAAGISPEDACRQIAVLDSRGLLVNDGNIRDAYKQEMAWSPALAEAEGVAEKRDLASLVEILKPTVLIGTSGQAGAFSESIVREMARHTDRPVILPLSNPTDQSEAKPADLLDWTDDKVLVAAGSPFEAVKRPSGTFEIGQGNNVFIFPGIGLGAVACEASQVTEGMCFAAAEALAGCVSEDELARGLLYPDVERLGDASRAVALAVMRSAINEGVSGLNSADCESNLDDVAWEPVYKPYEPI